MSCAAAAHALRWQQGRTPLRWPVAAMQMAFKVMCVATLTGINIDVALRCISGEEGFGKAAASQREVVEFTMRLYFFLGLIQNLVSI